MTLNLSEVTFEYDFFTCDMPSGNLLILNKVDESLLVDNESVEIKGINIVVYLYDTEENVLCSSVIGAENEYFSLNSDYAEYLGKTLTEDNMQYCTIELPEDDDSDED